VDALEQNAGNKSAHKLHSQRGVKHKNGSESLSSDIIDLNAINTQK